MALLGSDSIFYGGWFGPTGSGIPDNVEVDGWWDFYTPPEPHGDIISEISYAVQITTNTNATDGAVGLDGGVFRFITGRPGYDGVTDPFPSWGPNEILSGSICCEWFQGFINKDGLSNPSRSIDLSKGGDYGNVSAFTVKLRNNNKLWNSLLTNNISLIGSSVELFVVINDVFYQIWTGVVDSTPRTARDLIVKCADASAVIHQDLPRKNLNGNLITDIVGSPRYLEATRAELATNIPLTNNGESAALNAATFFGTPLRPSNTLDKFTKVWITLMTNGKTFAEDALVGKYINVNSLVKSGADLESSREKREGLFRIYESQVTSEINGINHTRVTCLVPPLADPPFLVPNNIAGYLYDANVVSDGVEETLIYMEALDIGTKYTVAQSGIAIDVDNLFKYDADTDEYVKFPVSAINNNDGTFDIQGSKRINEEGFEFFQSFSSDLVAGGIKGAFAEYPYDITQVAYDPSTNNIIFIGPIDFAEIPTGIMRGLIEVRGEFDALYGYVDGINRHIPGATLFEGTFTGLEFLNTPTAQGSSGTTDYSGRFWPQSLPWDDLKSLLTDKDTSTVRSVNVQPEINEIRLTSFYELNDIIASGESVYVMADMGAQSHLFTDMSVSVEWWALDIYGKPIILEPNNEEAGRFVTYEFSGTEPSGKFLGLPENYYNAEVVDLDFYDGYKPATTNYYDGNGTINGNGTPTAASEGAWGEDIFKMPDYIKELYNNGTITHVKVDVAMSGELQQMYKGQVYQAGTFIKKQQDLDKSIYALIDEDLTYPDDSDPNSVYKAFQYMLETSDGISASDIDYGNVPTTRAASNPSEHWTADRIFTKVQNSKVYIKELARHSYVGVYPDRKGRRALNAYLENTVSGLHDDSLIVRGSLRRFDRTPMKDVYNDFNIGYDWNYGAGNYTQAITVTNTEQSSFPSSSENWQDYVGGIPQWGTANELWQVAHSGYLLTQNKQSPPAAYNNLPFYRQYENENSSWRVGNSPVLYVRNLINWTSRQHYKSSYSIPITSDTVETELTDTKYIKNSLYTNDQEYKGYITKVTYDIKKDQIKLESMVEPADGFTPFSPLLYVETGTAVNQIVETGSQPDVIAEGN